MPRAPTPARSPPPRPLRCGEIAFRPTHDVGPHKQCISGLNHAAYGLPVNASRPGSPQAHASLGSGWRPTLAGWDWIPTGFRTRFQRSHHGILSPLTGLSRHTRWCTVPALPARTVDALAIVTPRGQDLDRKSRMHPQDRTTYRVGNWPAYDRALVERGDVTMWLAPAVTATWEVTGYRQAWRAAAALRPGHRDRPDTSPRLPPAIPPDRGLCDCHPRTTRGYNRARRDAACDYSNVGAPTWWTTT